MLLYTFEEFVTRLDNLIADAKSLHGDLAELQNKRTFLADFNAEFNKLVKKSTDIRLLKN